MRPDNRVMAPTRTAIYITLAAAAVGGIAVAIYLLVRPGDFTARGTVTINTGTSIVGTAQDGVYYDSHSCRGVDGYSDLAPGSRVSVSNSSGDIVAVGEILAGEAKTGVGESGCMLHFNVEQVPAGDGPYEVVVGHRESVVASEDELRRGAQLTIG